MRTSVGADSIHGMLFSIRSLSVVLGDCGRDRAACSDGGPIQSPEDTRFEALFLTR